MPELLHYAYISKVDPVTNVWVGATMKDNSVYSYIMVTSLDARLMILLCKKIVSKSKEVKARWSNLRQIWQNLLRKAMAQKGLLCQ
jgi:hypothetical protein